MTANDKEHIDDNDQPPQWWYLSFADDQNFRGGLFIRGKDIVECVWQAHRMALNPGGDVIAHPVCDANLPDPCWRERLLKGDDLDYLNTPRA